MTIIQVGRNLENVRSRITRASGNIGKNPSDIQLVAVTKAVGSESIREAMEAGVTIFGESYIQEARAKIPEITGPVRWDFIGHLQRNKARHAVDLFGMIHSVDSLALAQEINRIAGEKGKKVSVLVQVNISGEEAKSGINPAETGRLVQEIASLPNLALEGLMTIPPYFDAPEMSRPYFRALRQLRDAIAEQHRGIIRLQELSMGMSSDLEVAIEEGATMLRVGTAIFGERTT